MQPDAYRLIAILWTAIFLIWGISAYTFKRTIRSRSGGRARVAVWVVSIGWFLLFSRNLHAGPLAWRFVPMTPAAIYVGLVLTLAGFALSLWARFYLGRNWSALVTLKEDHKLVRTGPYAIVRHPIYSGFMLATLGTAIAFGELRGLISVALVVIAWGYKSRLEEALMVEQFGAEYERYRANVKGLIPFIW